MPGKRFLTVSLSLTLVFFCRAQTIFIASGSVWKYTTGTDLGSAWKNSSYNDSSWAQGPSQLGYGDGDEATVISNVPIRPTYYFRQKVNITNPNSYAGFTMQVKRDDGIVVYVNGSEIFRDNISADTSGYNSWAASTCSDDGAVWITAILSSAVFVNGINTIACEVHQASVSSSDLSFDLQLTGGTPFSAVLTRGPYLQLGTSTSIYVRWRTDVATDTKVAIGAGPGSLTQSFTDLFSTTEHIIRVTGLLPHTRYYYALGSTIQTLQGDSNNFFITAPTVGTEKITRIWATGDCGTAQTIQTDAMNAYQNFIGGNYTDIWLLLGDNAYNGGFDNEYQNNFFMPYMAGKVMRQTVIWPAPGNHDYNNSSSLLESRSTPYFETFTLPTAAEAGGVASGTEMYYSYNHANIHFISLDSYGTENGNKLFDTTGAQISWLKQDLAANTQKWTIVYWHHPPYTKGSHNSDTESELVNIRDKVIRILDRYKVDLVLCGHSHSYERSRMMKGHYGVESTFDSTIHNASNSSALYNGSANSCPYIKSSSSPVNEGIVYVVAGSAGKLGTSSSGYPHNAMYYSNVINGGSLYLEVNGNRLDGKWIASNGNILDRFTIMKDVNNSENVTIYQGDTIDLTASWSGLHLWNPPGDVTEGITISPTALTNYYVTDDTLSCLSDTFKVEVKNRVRISMKVLLGGAYNADSLLMNDDLRTNGFLPSKEPYTGIFTHHLPGGGETMDAGVLSASGNNAIVDWVFVELRDKTASANVIATRSALIQRDGDVVDMDGISPLSFYEIPSGEYFIAVRHLNHLGVMTKNAIALSEVTTSVDLTNPATLTWGTNAQANVGSKMVMWSGNVVQDGFMKYSGPNNDRDPILTKIGGTVPTNIVTGYYPEDVNRDGMVKYSGPENDRDIILQNIGGVMPTATIQEQLP